MAKTDKRTGFRPGTFLFVLCLWTIALCIGCFGNLPLYDDDLVAGYSIFAPDVEEQAMIFKGTSGVIGPMVFAFGWNDDFIIAKQHPEINIEGDIDTKVTNWFIVQVATEEIYGPLTEQEFTKLRKELGVPDELTFTRTIES